MVLGLWNIVLWSRMVNCPFYSSVLTRGQYQYTLVAQSALLILVVARAVSTLPLLNFPLNPHYRADYTADSKITLLIWPWIPFFYYYYSRLKGGSYKGAFKPTMKWRGWVNAITVLICTSAVVVLVEMPILAPLSFYDLLCPGSKCDLDVVSPHEIFDWLTLVFPGTTVLPQLEMVYLTRIWNRGKLHYLENKILGLRWISCWGWDRSLQWLATWGRSHYFEVHLCGG